MTAHYTCDACRNPIAGGRAYINHNSSERYPGITWRVRIFTADAAEADLHWTCLAAILGEIANGAVEIITRTRIEGAEGPPLVNQPPTDEAEAEAVDVEAAAEAQVQALMAASRIEQPEHRAGTINITEAPNA